MPGPGGEIHRQQFTPGVKMDIKNITLEHVLHRAWEEIDFSKITVKSSPAILGIPVVNQSHELYRDDKQVGHLLPAGNGDFILESITIDS
jgi:hypothetical protein